MKAVLISIQPKWCELIASGKKTVEVRKTKPKIETPFKCYIYCTQGNGYLESVNGKVQKLNYLELDLNVDNYVYELNGKVIGEFVCDEIKEITANNLVAIYFNNPQESTCLNDLEMRSYADGKNLFLWHISDLVIYDKPKELYEFQRPCNNDCDNCEYLDVAEVGAYEHTATVKTCLNIITRPPQSYMYVEQLR